MARYVQEGKIINFQNSSSDPIRFGDIVTLTDRIGVASADIAAQTTGAVELEGVFEFPAENSAAFTIGQTVYWDAANKRITATKAASGAILAGIVVAPKSTADSAALVKIN